MDDPYAPRDADDVGLSHQRVRQTLSSISLALGVGSLVASFTIPLFIGLEALGTAVRIVGLVPATMMLAGVVTAVAARRRGELGGLASAALAWNTLLLIVYAVMVVALFLNPVTPS